VGRQIKVSTERRWDGLVVEEWHEDLGNGKVKVHRKTFQEVDHIAKFCKESRNNSPRNFSKDQGIYLAARIPKADIEKWQAERGFDFMNASHNERRKWINREAPHFKTRGRR